MRDMTDSKAGSARQVQYLEVGGEEGEQRIDNFLRRHLKGVPKTRIYRLLRRGEVRVNGGRVRPAYRLRVGDRVRIPPVLRSQPAEHKPGEHLTAALADAVLYEDDALLALNKPAGVPVHGGTGISSGVIEALRTLRPDTKFLELVHRLDRETSGVLLIAKKRTRLRQLHAALREGRFSKRYEVLCAGRWSGGARRITEKLARNRLQSGERMVVAGEGQHAETWFRPRMVYNAGSCAASLMDAEPVTGRTHQIRVHAAEAGHPVAGDAKYGDRAFNRCMKTRGLTRMFLHAGTLGWPDEGGGMRFVEAPLPPALRDVLENLEKETGNREDA